MNANDIESMTTVEKLGLMEMLWHDLSKEPENIEVPKWHLEELEKSEKDVSEGRDHFIDLDEFEAELQETAAQRKAK